MSQKSVPILHNNFPYKMGQDFWDRQYIMFFNVVSNTSGVSFGIASAQINYKISKFPSDYNSLEYMTMPDNQ